MASQRMLAAGVAIVVAIVALGLLHYVAGWRFSVSDLQVANGTLYGLQGTNVGVVSFRLTNRNSVPVSGVSVTVNQANTLILPGDPVVSSSNPISMGQSRLVRFTMLGGEISGQSYFVSIRVDFGDGTNATFSATVTGS